LLLETPLLSALVDALVVQDMTLEEFIQSIYDKLGLIAGPARLASAAEQRLRMLSNRLGDPDDLLEELRTRLQGRLVRAGLARQFSDGLTMVFAR
jgi:hypothetical protein